MKIQLKNESYSLKFGLGFFRVLGRIFGDTTLNQTIARISVLDGVKDDIPYDFFDLIENIIVAAAESAGNAIEKESEDYDSIVEIIFSNPVLLQEIVTSIVESMPKQNTDQGKQKAPRKPGAKK